MVKKKADASLKGKKPVNTAKVPVVVSRNPGHISNKLKRSEVYGKYLQQKRAAKKASRLQRDKEAAALGDDVPIKKNNPKTLDNTREVDVTLVAGGSSGGSGSRTAVDDAEVVGDEACDEFASYFAGTIKPKVLITTRPRPSQTLFYFIADLQKMIPGLHFYPRKFYSVKEICTFAANREFTHLMVLSEKDKVCNGLSISHLRLHDGIGKAGPTAFFRVSNVVIGKDIPQHGASTSHVPELNLHGFVTRLGHRVGRLLASVFPHDQPQFQGRQVVTFHNQRDFIFVRQHRYIFRSVDAEKQELAQQKAAAAHAQHGTTATAHLPGVKTRLQELGPRFTLKLQWLQEGVFDTKFGEYEWIHTKRRKEIDSSRRKFHL
jgi:ribosome production factor 1